MRPLAKNDGSRSPPTGLGVEEFITVEPPKVETVDYSLSYRPWKPDPDAPVLDYDQMVAAHKQSIIDEDEQRAKLYAERAAAQSQRELENQRRAMAEAQQRRDIENFGEAAQG